MCELWEGMGEREAKITAVRERGQYKKHSVYLKRPVKASKKVSEALTCNDKVCM